jgi:type II secretory pathway component PulF
LTDSGTRQLAEEAARVLMQGLKADRVAVFRKSAEGTLRLAAVRGLTEFDVGDAPISMSLVQQVVATDSTVVFTNVGSDIDARRNISLLLSGATSALCIAFHDKKGTVQGALYADTLRRPRAFGRKELLFARECGVWLGRSACDGEQLAAPVPSSAAVAAPKAAVPAAPPKPKMDSASTAQALKAYRARSVDVAIFFRALSTMVGSGLMIHESLALLSRTAEKPRFGEVLIALSDIVLNGRPLSAAMETFPQTFPSYVVSAVRVGERSGRLAQVLDALARDLEKAEGLTNKAKSALMYPAFLGGACGLMLVLGPPLMLKGHLTMLQSSGVALPFLTRGLIALSHAGSNPLFYLLLIAGAGALAAHLRSAAGGQRARAMLRRVPVLGEALFTLSLARFTRSLSLQLRAGMTAAEALKGCLSSSEDPHYRQALRTALDYLRDGGTLAESLERPRYFPKGLLAFVEAGEQTGTLEKTTQWTADFYEQEAGMALDTLVQVAEPLLLAIMGAVTGALLIATLQPTLLLLQGM